MITGLRVAATAIRLAWVAAIVALMALMVMPHLLPALGRQVYIVRGASMQPAIPIGAVVVIEAVDPTDVQVGDVVTFRAASGTVVTHRVLAVNDAGDLSFSTKGDASTSPDPVIVPAASVLGRVEGMVPGLGSFLTTLATTAGTLAALGILGSLLLVGWFLEELAATLRPASARRSVAPAVN
jgi:signal peptidase